MNEKIRELISQSYEATTVTTIDPFTQEVVVDFIDGTKPFFNQEKFAELIVAECADLVKARLNHIPDNQDDWDGHNYGETAAVYGILDAFQEHFGVDCDPENSNFGVEE